MLRRDPSLDCRSAARATYQQLRPHLYKAVKRRLDGESSKPMGESWGNRCRAITGSILVKPWA